MRLTELKKKTVGKRKKPSGTQVERVALGVRNPLRLPPKHVAASEIREVQVKAAVFPTEKSIFEALAQKQNKTLSDLIRDFLVHEAKKAGLI